VLESAGYGVLGAADNEEALHLVRKIRPDFILTDVGMPLTAHGELRERLRGLPALVMSSGEPPTALKRLPFIDRNDVPRRLLRAIRDHAATSRARRFH